MGAGDISAIVYLYNWNHTVPFYILGLLKSF